MAVRIGRGRALIGAGRVGGVLSGAGTPYDHDGESSTAALLYVTLTVPDDAVSTIALGDGIGGKVYGVGRVGRGAGVIVGRNIHGGRGGKVMRLPPTARWHMEGDNLHCAHQLAGDKQQPPRREKEVGGSERPSGGGGGITW